MAQQIHSSSSSRSIPDDPLKPGTFQSLLPLIDDILGILHSQATGEERLTTAQASEGVAIKAKQLASAIEMMKLASINLPGGHLSIEELKVISERLDEESEKRLQILNAFKDRQMPLIDSLATAHNIGEEEVGSTMPSPTGQS
ncbi:hypothetical protein V865_003528 [Kwoniella europaea PYCC6329]|uniref:Mediator of RNA polymerase II transcription subunit 9 n=1 Tax=Kwoniella europaea PYCC6329 TaxID=1423913 RepID=A0AAX4KG19_9TREE